MSTAVESDLIDSSSTIPVEIRAGTTKTVRLLGWSILALMFVFVLNNFLNYGAGFPGAPAISMLGSGSGLGLLQFALYPLSLGLVFAHVSRSTETTLRVDGERISSINAFLIRAAFWGVLFVGLADLVISFMRVEDLLGDVVGEQMAKNLGRSHFRGPYIHMPALGLGFILAFFTRTLGFQWLALFVVVAELLIVLSRFIFSYEQAFMADLVRFWYGALFLFASAHTLLEEGHVRVDVAYAAFSERSKGIVNVVGSLALGVLFCWTILLIGMGGKSSIINAPIFNFEVTQSGFGLYVKYLMAAFLGIFAISMMIQFVSYMFGAVADVRGEPGKRVKEEPAAH